ncbi:MAG: lipopolysaccharide biosynthesis protein [Muribaculum sp.]|nr:lipopolysaccharide biosynthesis protein [Muribaculum sp.]
MDKNSELHKNIVNASKWSTITEIAAKLITPISSMILARLLAPEMFGVMVTVTMVISFAEIFTDAGFQKYLIQHKFDSKDSLYESTNVAFWSNFVMSMAIWGIIIIFCQPIATLVGNPGRGDVIAISCVCIPLAAFSSIQMALFKRDLDFKTLFHIRIIGVLIPLVVTIPIALYNHSYWSLVIGMIALNVFNAIILTLKSNWKPKFSYRFKLFKEMFSFTSLSMIEAFAIWLTSYADIFIVGKLLDQYYLGLYRTSMITVGQIMALVTSATTPILFSALSKVQDDDEHFRLIFFKFQKVVGLIVIPVGMGIFVFKSLITDVLLGSQWSQAAWLIGLWGVSSALMIVLSHYSSEVYRSKGKPLYSVMVQVLHILILVPAVWWGAHQSYEILCDVRTLVRITLLLINMPFLYMLVKISLWDMLNNLKGAFIASILTGTLCIFLLHINDNIALQIGYVILALAVYLGIIYMFPVDRRILFNLKEYLKK